MVSCKTWGGGGGAKNSVALWPPAGYVGAPQIVMYICVYVLMHVSTSIYAYICVFAYMYLYIHTHTYACV